MIKQRLLPILAARPTRLFLAITALFSGLAIAGALVEEPLQARVAALRADPVTVEIDFPPLASDASGTWLPEAEQWRLRQIVLATVALDPFDHDSLMNARDELDAAGWFAEPPTLRRLPKNVITVEGAWRRPAAVVRAGGRDRLVSTEGRLLPLAYAPGEATGLKVIQNAWADPPRWDSGGLAYGSRWMGGDVQAAVRLLETLRNTPAWPHVAGVDVSSFLDRNRLTILIEGGGRLIWGAPPSETPPGEQPAQVKLRRLIELVESPAWIGAGRPTAELYTPFVYIDETARR